MRLPCNTLSNTQQTHGLTPAALSRSSIGNRKSGIATAFTLTELLVVIGLIVVLISLAVPTFSALRGANSVENATNVVSASLASARARAVGLQQNAGVLLYRDIATDRIAIAMIERKLPANWGTDVEFEVGDYVIDSGNYFVCITPHKSAAGNQPANTTYWSPVASGPFAANRPVYDVVGGVNTLNLPTGIGCVGANGGTTPYMRPGCIIFDENGQVTSTLYYLTADGIAGRRMSFTAADLDPDPAGSVYSWNSQVALMLFENEIIKAAGYSDASISESGTPLLVNRYNGTLVKGE